MKLGKSKKYIIVLIALAVIVIAGVSIHNSGYTRTSNTEQVSTKHIKHKQRTRVISPAEFNKISINVSATDIAVRSGNKYQVKIMDTKDTNVSSQVKQDTLIIRDHGPGRPFGDAGWANQGLKLKVLITIPTNQVLSAVIANCLDGDFSLKDVQLQTLKFRSDTGDFKLADTQPEKLNIKTDSGDSKLSHVVIKQDCKFKTDSGDSKLSHVVIKQDGKFKTDSGDLTVLHSQLKNFFCKGNSDVNITNSKLSGYNTYDLSGDFNLHQASKKDNYQLMTDEGEVKFFGNNCGNKFSKKNSSNDNLIKVENDYGDILIN
ncbi:DUF4097 family beta strand repeat-containing protein [Lactobacillus sp. ESL0680]|uniref:DUF4097 family beta strand repeat-containing protein n=1 Tax=Lactobacillus sp. ESL0680 TaxID=2983210 RepID=UPI0023FA007D|nr:DUF4097 family beta strand repeat-containing protein [Lactobacillus sp. ESL0680]WEV38753.1 DUF4097 family beta strand repeat-containing protein [Lactobacillus sp. ESL0680]